MKTDAIFPFGADKYSIGTVDAIDQFHLFRRFAPLMATMGVEFLRLMAGAQDPKALGKVEWIAMAAPMLGELSKMPQDDVNYLIVNSLKVVRKDENGTWAPLLNGQGQLMYANLGMFVMLRLILEVLRHNLGDFFDWDQPEEGS